MKTGRTLLRICVYVGSVVAGSSPVGFVFVVNNLDSIRDKTIPAGQNADFGGFLRSKAVSTGRFSSSAIKCRRCRRRSVPARSGAAQFALRATQLTSHQSAALRWSLFSCPHQYFIRDKTILAGQNADFGGFLRSKAGSAGRFSGSVIKCCSCLRRSVPARSGAAQFVLWAPPLTGHQSAALQ